MSIGVTSGWGRRCDKIKPMSDFKPRPGTFLPFLESSQRDAPKPTMPLSPLTLLAVLAQQPQQSLPLFVLQSLSGMDPSRYSEALKSLLEAGFITFAGSAPEQTVTLTDGGAKVAQLARSA